MKKWKEKFNDIMNKFGTGEMDIKGAGWDLSF